MIVRLETKNLKRELICLLLFFLMATFLRIYKIRALTTFSADQGRDALIIKEILIDHRPTLLGPKTSISNVHLGPIYYYFLSPFFWLFKLDPIAGSIMSVIFDLGALMLIFYFATLFFNRQTAFFAAILYTISPQVIEFSRVSLNPFIIPFFSILALLSIAQIFIKKKSVFFLPLFISLAVLIQLHYLNFPLILLILTAVLSFISTQKFDKKKFFFGVILGILIIVPLIAFELRHQFFNTKAFFAYIKTSGATFNLHGSVFNFLNLISSYFALNQTLVVILAFLIISILIISLRSLKKTQRNLTIFLLITIIFEIFSASFIKEDLAPFYFICLQPIIFLLVPLAITFLYQKIKIAGVLLFLFLVLFSLTSLDYQRKNGYTMPEGWNMIGVQKAASIIAQDVQTKDFNVAATLDGDTRAIPYRFFLEAIHKKPPMDVVQYPEAEVLYVISRNPEEIMLSNPVWEIASFTPKKLEKKWHLQNQIFLYKLEKIKI